MREIEIRRHTFTKKGQARGRGSEVSAAGVELARQIAQDMGQFDLVLSSGVPRTLETTLAMGYAVDDRLVIPPDVVTPAQEVIGHHERWSWDQPWAKFAALVQEHAAVAQLGDWLLAAWRDALTLIPDGKRVLVVSHGRFIEVGVIACLPDLPRASLESWGAPLHHGEGVRMSFSGHFGDPRLLRVHRAAVVNS